MRKDKQSSLDQIEKEILKKNVCPDLAQTANRLVMGAGNPDANIVFIGEAPGKKEDEKGIPFVGAAGKFLDEMLSSIGMNREDIYITNIVKYRPPDNRDPKLEEKKAFFPYLTSQLGVIEPKIIVPLGRHAMNAFLPDFVISEVHGKAFRRKLRFGAEDATPEETLRDSGEVAGRGAAEKRTEADMKSSEGASQAATKSTAPKKQESSSLAGSSKILPIVIVPLYHPAAALYNGSLRATLLEDFAGLPSIISKLN